MSRSNPTLTSPAKRIFQWSGSKGQLNWYDKEKEERVSVTLPFEFLVLDELAQISGFSRSDESSIWSNEVRNISKDMLYVRTKKGPLEAAFYQGLTVTRARGGKYTKSVYIAFKNSDHWDIGNIKMTGSALSAWIEFGKKHVVENGKVTMTMGDAEQGIGGTYYPPSFKWDHSDPEDDQQAVYLDKMLQIYLTQALNIQRDEEGREVSSEDNGYATEEQKADFEARRAASSPTVGTGSINEHNDIVIEDLGEEPINLDDIPF